MQYKHVVYIHEVNKGKKRCTCACGEGEKSYSWVVFVEVGLDVSHGLHGQLQGVDSLVREARVEETALHTQCPHHGSRSTCSEDR